jgi:lysophospholipase L1-like esterase
VKLPLVGLLCGLLLAHSARAETKRNDWVDTFQSSPAAYVFSLPKDLPKEYEYLKPHPPITGTLRFRLSVSVGGIETRVRFSNEVGDQPLSIVSASLALAADGSNATSGSVRRLTFDGKAGITIPPGAPALSDPVDLKVAPLGDLLVSIYVTQGISLMPLGNALMYLTPGDVVMSETLAEATPVIGRPIVTGISIRTSRPTRAIVTLGDSITDGNRYMPGAAHGWPEVLANRLLAERGKSALAVVNAGIGGNRLLRSSWGQAAVARFDRDVLAVPGVSHVILLEGINDIGMAGQSIFGIEPDLEVNELIAGYAQIIARAHIRGVKIFAGTLLPFRGARYFSEEKETKRLAVNAWIRTTKSFDGTIDFEAAVRDPNAPDKLRVEYDSGDHLHPNDAGYTALGDAIDIKLFD